MTPLVRPASIRVAVLAVMTLSCRPDSVVSITDTASRTVTVSVGQTLEITLQTVGPGEYQSPPTISSDIVRFVDVTLVDPVPAGATQRFRFATTARGTAVISFRHSGMSPAVDDTVVVR
jgi:hypothetical protein